MARPRLRRSRQRTPKRRVLVVGEGKQTEPNYFRGLRDEDCVRENFAVIVKAGAGKTPLETVEKAIELAGSAKRKGKDFGYDKVWCVLDVEQAGENPHLAEARQRARENDICVVLSNPAFEVWFVAHFERTTKSFVDCERLIDYLDKHWQREFGGKYEKNDPKVYRHLCDRTENAIRNAKTVREVDFSDKQDIVDCNSATEVYKIVETLLGRQG